MPRRVKSTSVRSLIYETKGCRVWGAEVRVLPEYGPLVPPLQLSLTSFTTMERDLLTVERFYNEHAGALGLRLLAGKSGLKRVIREPTVNRPGLALAG